MRNEKQEITDKVHRTATPATGRWRRVGILCLIVAAMAIASPAQDEQPSTDPVKFTTLFNFDYANGDGPTGAFVQGIDGNFYGTAEDGGVNGQGTIFKITPRGTLTTLHSFNGTDGDIPVAGLVLSPDGNFYGTSLLGGTSSACGPGCGTVFKISPGGKLTTLHNFEGTDGSYPGPLTQGTDGNFYGTTGGGGAHGEGTVFTITAAGALKTLYSFCSQTGCADGSGPDSNMALIQGSDGNFYGTTVPAGPAPPAARRVVVRSSRSPQLAR
jgi:uncharacterized repeat protein (TIGR03803 family)